MAGIFLFANNAVSQLAGPITNVGTICNITPGSGRLFPSPASGNFFCLTFNDYATGLLNEICHCTNRSVDTLTIVRAQEGTVGLNWSAQDFASNLLTAGSLSNFMQAPQGIIYSGVDTGVANNYFLATMSQGLPSGYFTDMTLVFVPLQTNTGPSTVNCLGLGNVPIVRAHSSLPLLQNDIMAGVPVMMIYDGSKFCLYSSDYPPPLLKQNSNLYVDATTGSDTLYDGTSSTISGVHGPFKTIQRAVNETFKYGPSIYLMTINVAAGVYNEAVTTPNVLGPTVLINGAGIGSVLVTGANNAHTFAASAANQMYIQNLTVSTGTGMGPPCAFSATTGATIVTLNTASNVVVGYVWSAYAGYISVGPHTFNSGGNFQIGISAVFGGFASFQEGVALTFAGPCICTAFISCNSNGSLAVPAPAPYLPTFYNPGYCTGYKFLADSNGVINTQGQSLSYFPGSLAGLTQRGGQYI